jgi:uncharacterized protein YgbK (DUF1537 family)
MEKKAWSAPSQGIVRRTMIVSGSNYPTSLEQLDRAAAAFGERVLAMAGTTSAPDLARQCKGRTAVFLQLQTDSLLRGHGRFAIASLFRKVREIIRLCNPQALGIIGGETAFQILRLMGASRLEVFGKRQQGMPFGIVGDGELAGRPLATKGGSVGTPDACVQMVECLRLDGEGAS